MRNTFIETVIKFSRNNPPPYLITGDLGYSVLELFQKEFPDNFINVGILEQSMMSMSAGIASQNQKVFAGGKRHPDCNRNQGHCESIAGGRRQQTGRTGGLSKLLYKPNRPDCSCLRA